MSSSSDEESVSCPDTRSSTPSPSVPAVPVFIKDSEYCWLPALLMNESAHATTVQIDLPENWSGTTCCDSVTENSARLNVDLSGYPERELPLQNVDENGTMRARSDMSDLPQLHEAAVLYNLKNRHAQGVPYTRVGDIIVATNPFRWVDGLYSEEKQDLYANRLVWNEMENDQRKTLQVVSPQRFSATSFRSSHRYTKLTLDPHVYESSSHAYRGLAIHNQNQAILVTGTSGAGKTETVKIVMRHLAKLHLSRPITDIRMSFRRTRSIRSVEQMNSMVEMVLEANPVFEAFGNAKTVRNNNSSRFGKFTQLQFEGEENTPSRKQIDSVPLCILAGSVCDTYLLEKTRVVGHAIGERTYHIFYQLLASPKTFKKSVWAGLEGKDATSFRYLCCGAVEEEDEREWIHTVRSLGLFGIFDEELGMLMRALCIILQLGNLDFTSNSNEQAMVKCSVELEKVADLMGLSPERVSIALTTRQTIARGSVLNFALSPDAAKGNTDALAKEVYEMVFAVVVRAVNTATRGAEDSKYKENTPNSPDNDKDENHIPYGVISLLDIFGFEKFKVNRFEQLCINYANERLQQKYVTDVFKGVTAEYVEEGIEIFDFSMVDNTKVVNLIEGRTGIIAALNEECKLAKGKNDVNFVYNVKKLHNSTRLVNGKILRATEFGIQHFAGPVKYDATKIVEKNNDELPPILIDLACDSSNSLLQREFGRLKKTLSNQNSKTNRRARGNKATVVTKFRTQLNKLMDSMKGTKIRYIRCIKPNPLELPGVMDHKMTLSQLSSAGLVTAIIIQRETFPDRLPYSLVLERFRCLIDKATNHMFDVNGRYYEGEESSTSIERVGNMLTLLLDGKERIVGGMTIAPYACGKTKVFFRTGTLDILETHRVNLYQKSALSIQSWWRCLMGKIEYLSIKAFIVGGQAIWRGFVARKLFSQIKRRIVVIQSWARVVLAKNQSRYLKGIRALLRLQARYRTWAPKVYVRKRIDAVIFIQTILRARKHTSVFGKDQAVRVEEARMGYKQRNLLKKLTIVDENGKHSHPERLLMHCQEMLLYMENESERQRELIVNVRAKLEEQNQNFRKLVSEKESAREELAANEVLMAEIVETDAARHKEFEGIMKVNAQLQEYIATTQKGVKVVPEHQHRGINRQLGKTWKTLRQKIRFNGDDPPRYGEAQSKMGKSREKSSNTVAYCTTQEE